MPIAPAAKGIILVSGILITASIALYENEQVRQWVETTGRKIAGTWDDILNFEQRQRQRRAQAYAFGGGAGDVQELGNRAQQLPVGRRDRMRKMYEAAGSVDGAQEMDGKVGVDEASERAVKAAATARDNMEAEGLRKRKARESESQEHLLNTQPTTPGPTREAEALFDKAEDPAISVPELDAQAVQSTDPVSNSNSRASELPASLSAAASPTELSTSAPTLLDYELPPTIGQNNVQSLLDQQTNQNVTQTPLTAANLINNTSTTPPTATQHLTNQQDTNPFSDAHSIPASNLTLTIPTIRSRAQSTSTLSPVLVHTPTSVSSVSDGMHTPQHEDDLEAISAAGTETETASQFSEWREDGDDDLQSVASEESGISGWSEIGSVR